MKSAYHLIYLILLINISCYSQNRQIGNNEQFSEQIFMNSNVYYKLKKYSTENKIIIADPDKQLVNQDIIYNNKELKIYIISKKNKGFDFLIKKVIINESLAFIVMWNKDSVTALCLYPFLSEFTPNKWLVEEITTRSIK